MLLRKKGKCFLQTPILQTAVRKSRLTERHLRAPARTEARSFVAEGAPQDDSGGRVGGQSVLGLTAKATARFFASLRMTVCCDGGAEYARSALQRNRKKRHGKGHGEVLRFAQNDSVS